MGIIQDMMRRKYQQEDAAARKQGVNALIGERGFEQAGPMQQQPNGLMEQRQTIGGSGLMGGAGMFDPNNMGEFATGLMGVSGMENVGAQILTNLQGNKNRAQMSEQNNANKLLMQQFKNNTWSPAQKLKTTTAQQTQFNKENAPMRKTLTEFNNTTNMIRDRGGFDNLTSTDHLGMINSLIKTLRPNEAINEGDYDAVLSAAGFTELGAIASNVVTGKKLTPQQSQDVYQFMQGRAEQAQVEGEQLREMTGGRLQGTPINPSQVMQQQVPFQPLQQQQQQGGAPMGGSISRSQPNAEQQRFAKNEANRVMPDGSLNMIPAGTPFQDPRWPDKWVMYDDAGGILEYEQ